MKELFKKRSRNSVQAATVSREGPQNATVWVKIAVVWHARICH